ncbi:hypothetical protein [Mesorhizobium sp.]|uniref:hypothetical protein n=1 Tax=Mesorhizobium sp. TaxID=1871066 RepID=UPI000FE91C09|nr:hypothetical protein [Mesorhizobium sp.]RWC63889.1 MAG: hypothetical protein EOS56_04410 [Mesorhizobium sp.]
MLELWCPEFPILAQEVIRTGDFMKRASLWQFVESIAIRIAPGLLNIVTLLYIGSHLETEQYGIFSTTIATVSFISTLVFGAATYSIMPVSAKMHAAGMGREYVSSILTALAIMALFVVLAGLALAWFGFGDAVAATIIVSFGLHTALQEVLRSQLRLWAYGWSAIGQAVAYQVGAIVLLAGDAKVGSALTAFSLSYFAGALVSFAYLGPMTLRRPRFSYLGGSLATGWRFVLSNLAESGMFVGIRYIILLFGSETHLGVFSFCVDLSQRSVGFFMNAASFVFVPRAFLSAAHGNFREFRRGLFEGATIALIFAIAAAAGISGLFVSGYASGWLGTSFDPVVFGVVSCAVLVNRTKKVVIDPFALRSNKAMTLTYSYAIGALACCCLAAMSLWWRLPLGSEMAFLSGYVVAAACSFFALRSVIADNGPDATQRAFSMAGSDVGNE